LGIFVGFDVAAQEAIFSTQGVSGRFFVPALPFWRFRFSYEKVCFLIPKTLPPPFAALPTDNCARLVWGQTRGSKPVSI